MIIKADWPAPAAVIAGVTTRSRGASEGPYSSNNMALHVGDVIDAVHENRKQLDSSLPGIKEWFWLNQVHGTRVIETPFDGIPDADACISRQSGQVCTVMTADCLPIVLCNREGNEVAAIHAGWRSLASGVVINTLAAMASAGEDILAWLGPAIGPGNFEVGKDVYDAFSVRFSEDVMAEGFRPGNEGKFYADLYRLAEAELEQAGVSVYKNHDFCTVADKQTFYSYRRDGITGRMATFIYFLD